MNLYQLRCLKALKILCTEKAEVQQEGCLPDDTKVPSQTVLHLQHTLYLSGLYPVEGGVGC